MPQPLRSVQPSFLGGQQAPAGNNPQLMSTRARVAYPMPVQSPAYEGYRNSLVPSMFDYITNQDMPNPAPAEAPDPMMRNQGYQPINPRIAQMLMDRSQMRGRLGR